MSQSLTSAESRALKLLGDGFPNSVVASATGLSDSRVSQLLTDAEFSKQVSELRYNNLAKHNDRDAKADSIEDTVLEQLERNISLVHRPLELARIYSIINAGKRRGQSAPDHTVNQQPAVALVMPTLVIQNFTKSVNNQIVAAGDLSLVTIQPKQLQEKHHGLLQETPRLIEEIRETSTGILERVQALREKQKASA
jgi:hypothetical protein